MSPLALRPRPSPARPIASAARTARAFLRALSSSSSSPSSSSASAAVRPRFSQGADAAALSRALAPLLASSGGRWELTADGQGLERAFRFKTFARTWDFMTAVSLQCKLRNHHPEWSNAYNTAFVRWTTHHPAGLSAPDVDLAAACDALARDFGEEGAGAGAGAGVAPSCGLRGLADRGAASAGDCCTPGKKQ